MSRSALVRLSHHALLVAALVCGADSRAHAQSDVETAHKQAARELFSEGLKYADDQRWTEAESRFRRALEFRQSPVIAFNLASVLAKQSRLTEASETLHGVLRADALPDSVREPAAQLLAEIEPRIGRLTIEVRGGGDEDVIELDGRALKDAELGIALPIDPGTHSLTATRGTDRIVSDSVTIQTGGAERILIDLPPPDDGVGAASVTLDVPQPAPDAERAPYMEYSEDRSGGASWVLWAGAGVAVVGVAVLAIVLVSSSGTSDTETPFQGDFDPPSVRVVVAP